MKLSRNGKLAKRIIKRIHRDRKRKTIVILLGAGGAKPWGGPLANDLESVIIENNKYKTTTDHIPVGRFIFDKLREFYTSNEEVNFETFLGFLETLVEYVFSETNEGYRSPSNTSFMPSGFEVKEWISEIMDFQVSQELENGRVILRIPAEAPFGDVEERSNIQRIFFFKLYNHFLSLIARRIEEYSYTIHENSNLNNSLIQFIRFLNSKNTKIRIYTTNYDRLLQKTLGNQCKVFDGFSDNSGDDYYEYYSYQPQRIYEDSDNITYYNLHGSLCWDKDMILPNRGNNFYCYPNQTFPGISWPTLEQVNPGQTLISSNIITGYNKVQRVSLEPINYFNYAFMRDCLDSELLISIGYSFNDIHINRVLKTILNKPKFSFYHITKNANPDDFFSSREYSNIDDLKEVTVAGLPDFQNNEDNPYWHLSKGEQIIRGFYLDGFDGFLENEEWLKMDL
ncbi:SIR2 family protein [Marinilabilia rubra]|uniref:Uncharacterized protein n=1 Tax=Marinilabilia rubra TaxID=2162893 RepID=A0A2U2BAC3_9BACT|nr:SIR2 family protein [Marinilabilia rubra]PWE00016.1 hypothetical protein DDZ16_06535 [Marinilabilia rubra]